MKKQLALIQKCGLYSNTNPGLVQKRTSREWFLGLGLELG